MMAFFLIFSSCVQAEETMVTSRWHIEGLVFSDFGKLLPEPPSAKKPLREAESRLHDQTFTFLFPIEFLFNDLTEWIWRINKSMKEPLSRLFNQTVYALIFLLLLSGSLWSLNTGPEGTWRGGGDLLNISQMNGNQNQMTQLRGPIIGGGFKCCDEPSLISLANAFLSPLRNYDKRFRSKVWSWASLSHDCWECW